MAAMLKTAASKRQRSPVARSPVPMSQASRRLASPETVDGVESELDSSLSQLTVSDLKTPEPVSAPLSPISLSPAKPVAKRSRRTQPDALGAPTTTFLNSLIPIFRGPVTTAASQSAVVAASGGSESENGGRDGGAPLSSSPSAAPATVSKEELDAMTFAEYFSYYLTAPENQKPLTYLYSDRQYMLLLSSCSANKVSDMDISDKDRKYLYNKRNRATYSSMDMIYRDSNGHVDIGAVVVCWPGKAQTRRGYDKQRGGKRGDKDRTSHGSGDDTAKVELSMASMRRCVPVSQIELVLNLVHVGRAGHRGQDATVAEVQKVYDGITRDLVREFVARCGICQMRLPKKYKAALRPIITRQLGERHQVDLIDFHTESDGDFKYIMHVTDHWSRFRWGFTLTDKTAWQVAFNLRIIWMIHGPPKILQSDNGGEFKGEVIEICREYNVQTINSAPYHPQSQGQVEKLNGVVKTMLRKWQEQERTRAWAAAVPKIFLQMNTTVCSAIKTTPYELMFGSRFRQDMQPIGDPLFLDALMGELNSEGGTDRTAALDQLTNLAVAADLRLPSASAASDLARAAAEPSLDESEIHGRQSQVGGRESKTGGRESKIGGRQSQTGGRELETAVSEVDIDSDDLKVVNDDDQRERRELSTAMELSEDRSLPPAVLSIDTR